MGLGAWLVRRGHLKKLSPRPVLAGLAVMLLVLGFFSARPRPSIDHTKLLVMGWDGATFSQIDPLIEAGRLPHLAALREQGSSQVLRSMEPMFSPLLWTTMATGKPPEEHGVHGFSVHASDVKTPRFWDLAEAQGEGIGVYKWLVTYPPRSVDGFIVPAWLAPSALTWPAALSVVKEIELSNRLERKGVRSPRSGAALLLDGIRQGFRWGTVRDSIRWKLREWRGTPDPRERRVRLERLRLQMDRDVFLAAASRADPALLSFTLYAIDSLGHRFWRYHEPEAFEGVSSEEVAQFGEVISEAYVLADQVLGEFLEAVGDEATVVVLSDHGFQALRAEGANKSFFAPKTERLQARLSASLGKVDVFRLGQKLTVALREEGQSMEDLEAALNALVDEMGVPFYALEAVPDSPRSIGLKLAKERVDEERIAGGRVGGEPMRAYVEMGSSVSGDHHMEGIFILRGDGIEAGATGPEMQLLDVAPTLQGLLGIAPAEDLTGTARFGAPTGGPASWDAMVQGFEWLDDGLSEEVNHPQLRALGYIE
jgi:predicted AlkP superfamily phosphohydrolase/phosphomutase